MTSRRRFLKMASVAPAALPVAAKEAAVKMGIGLSTRDGMAIFAGGTNTTGLRYPSVDEAEQVRKQLDWLRDNRGKALSEAKRNLARGLDSDIAALRSVSPAWALNVQAERIVERDYGEQKNYLMRRLSELTGGLL